MAQPLKILHLSDLHFNTGVCDWVLQGADADIICISGDLFDDSRHCRLTTKQQIDWYLRWLDQITVPVFICSGNHDVEENLCLDDDWLLNDLTDLDEFTVDFPEPPIRVNLVSELSSDNVFIDGSISEYKGYRIGCVGYESPNLRPFKDCDIVLHHVPPSNTPVAKQGGRDWGCHELRAALDCGELAPKVLLCGHVHKPQKSKAIVKRTQVINGGSSNIEKLNNQSLIVLV
ncbi:metallophosphoesterase family protein [Photobacterium profundum]|uniref:Calcineurin-like phosphoesterase domain-containing protein n=1 Tax=Photobacterium profundum (strain SS9) TaxID=298386 RepID=Q6LTT3_PHOPR|nr:metallophosphoesterase [Photobacterium profundum]CAG19292.1 hypothetical protein PBPRA0880 [Photobacterium profundum SS9]